MYIKVTGLENIQERLKQTISKLLNIPQADLQDTEINFEKVEKYYPYISIKSSKYKGKWNKHKHFKSEVLTVDDMDGHSYRFYNFTVPEAHRANLDTIHSIQKSFMINKDDTIVRVLDNIDRDILAIEDT